MPEIEAALRELVRLRAAGLCEYCRISERFTLAEHEIDHVIAVKHGGRTVVENLALCCTLCNRFNLKTAVDGLQIGQPIQRQEVVEKMVATQRVRPKTRSHERLLRQKPWTKRPSAPPRRADCQSAAGYQPAPQVLQNQHRGGGFLGSACASLAQQIGIQLPFLGSKAVTSLHIDSKTGQLTPLFHPRIDRWDDHYEFSNGEILGLTARGRATARVLQMNRPTRIKERQLLRR